MAVVLLFDVDYDRAVRLFRLIDDLVLRAGTMELCLVVVQLRFDSTDSGSVAQVFLQNKMDRLKQASGLNSFHRYTSIVHITIHMGAILVSNYNWIKGTYFSLLLQLL